MVTAQNPPLPNNNIIPSAVHTDSTGNLTTPTPQMMPVAATATHTTPTPTSGPTLSPTPPVWEYLAPGMQRTTVYAPIPDRPEDVVGVRVVRLDPALVTFQVFYDSEEPKFIEEWLPETRSELVINGGFFAPDNRSVGRMVIDGELFGAPLGTTGRVGTPGLFAVLGDDVAIYALGYSGYSPRGLRFEQAIEAYPMLLLPGQMVAYPEPEEEGRNARRTVIGLDQQGQIVILLMDAGIYSLRQLALWLATSNLQLDTALNLDGGRSSGLAMDVGSEQEVIPSYVELPIVLAVYTRD